MVCRLVLLNLNFIKRHLSTEFYLVSVIDSYVCLANDFFCVSLCLGLVFIVCMYYVTVIALSHHVSVVMCFVHIIIIIIITTTTGCTTGREG